MGCQTTLTLPLAFDLEKVLGKPWLNTNRIIVRKRKSNNLLSSHCFCFFFFFFLSSQGNITVMKRCVIQCRRVWAAPPCDENYSLMAKIVIVAQTARALQVQREAMPVTKSHLPREETALKVLREKLYLLSFPPLRPVVCQLRRLLQWVEECRDFIYTTVTQTIYFRHKIQEKKMYLEIIFCSTNNFNNRKMSIDTVSLHPGLH